MAFCVYSVNPVTTRSSLRLAVSAAASARHVGRGVWLTAQFILSMKYYQKNLFDSGF